MLRDGVLNRIVVKAIYVADLFWAALLPFLCMQMKTPERLRQVRPRRFDEAPQIPLRQVMVASILRLLLTAHDIRLYREGLSTPSCFQIGGKVRA
jgi:hypothetical protein